MFQTDISLGESGALQVTTTLADPHQSITAIAAATFTVESWAGRFGWVSQTVNLAQNGTIVGKLRNLSLSAGSVWVTLR